MKQGNKKNNKKRKNSQIKKKNTKKKINKKVAKKNNVNKNTKSNLNNKSTNSKTKKKREEVVVSKSLEKKKTLSNKSRKILIFISIFCLILAFFLVIPYGTTNYKSEASGKILEIPKFSKLSEECCMYGTTFTSIRSYSSLKNELEKIISKYEKLNCDGKEYFYNKEEDFTITEYEVKRGLIFNKFFITYGNGNSCEIDTSLKNIELLPNNYSIADAKKDGSYVIENGKVYNSDSYNDFLDNVSKKIPSTLRIAALTKEGDLILTDLKYLSDGKFKVIYDGTRDQLNGENAMIAYVYEHIGVYKNKLYAYNGKEITKNMLKTKDVYYLFDVEK